MSRSSPSAFGSSTGDGNFTQVQTEKGSLTAAALVNTRASGTYTVNLDCTGTVIIPGGAQNQIVVVDRGKEIRWVVTFPGVVTIYGSALRQ